MQKAIAALTLVGVVLFLASSVCSILNAQLTYTTTEIPSDNVRQTTNAERIQNAENREEIVCSSITGSEEAKTSQSVASGDCPQFQPETNQDANASSDIIPPDGAIYYGGEPPYAYIPTYTPKEFGRLPIVPIDPEAKT